MRQGEGEKRNRDVMKWVCREWDRWTVWFDGQRRPLQGGAQRRKKTNIGAFQIEGRKNKQGRWTFDFDQQSYL